MCAQLSEPTLSVNIYAQAEVEEDPELDPAVLAEAREVLGTSGVAEADD